MEFQDGGHGGHVFFFFFFFFVKHHFESNFVRVVFYLPFWFEIDRQKCV